MLFASIDDAGGLLPCWTGRHQLYAVTAAYLLVPCSISSVETCSCVEND